MIRLSVGIEHIDDILEDLDQALDARRPQPLDEAMPLAAGAGGGQAPPGRARSGRRASGKPLIRVALVNNMPDAALLATERQFSARLEEAAGEACEVRLDLYALPGVSRGDLARASLRERYRWTDALEKAGADAVIVTGCEPRSANLRDEPYWGDFARLVDWAATNTSSALFSCLAAHAAVLHLDGVERRRAGAKLSGVFAFEKVADDPLTAGIEGPVRHPHSRHYGLPPEDLAAKGYRILTRSPQAGADIFLRDFLGGGTSRFVFLQGHPEYDAETLLREYRRDFGRFLRGEQAAAPACPQGYFDPQVQHALQALTLGARRGRVAEALTSLDEITAQFRPEAVWRENAVRLYRNWLALIAAGAVRIKPRRILVDTDELRLQRLPGAAE
jgi:homoserine O-succinyltransferase